MTTITAHLNDKLGQIVELREVEGRTYGKRVRRMADGTWTTKRIDKQVYRRANGWLYIVNVDERGTAVARKVSYKDCK